MKKEIDDERNRIISNILKESQTTSTTSRNISRR
jgi:hypothetical protein